MHSGRVASVPVTFSTHAEGGPGPSPLGTGGTLNGIRFLVKSEPPAYVSLNPVRAKLVPRALNSLLRFADKPERGKTAAYAQVNSNANPDIAGCDRFARLEPTRGI